MGCGLLRLLDEGSPSIPPSSSTREWLSARQRLADRPDGTFIAFRGKLPLSTVLAVGFRFPEAGGYRFRTEQPTWGKTFLWRSDVGPSGRVPRATEREGAPRDGRCRGGLRRPRSGASPSRSCPVAYRGDPPPPRCPREPRSVPGATHQRGGVDGGVCARVRGGRCFADAETGEAWGRSAHLGSRGGWGVGLHSVLRAAGHGIKHLDVAVVGGVVKRRKALCFRGVECPLATV